MSNELTVIEEKREITPAVWQMISAIVDTTSTSQLQRVGIAQKMLFAYENNLPLNLAFNGGLYNVNGRVEVEGNVIRAQIRKHPHYDYQIIELNEQGCTLAITHDGNEIGRVSFGMEDATRAGLLKGKDNWEKYPADMFLNRATSRAYKRYCPDIFFTPVYVRGEIEGNDFETPKTIQGNHVEKNGVMDALNQLMVEYGQDIVFAACDGRFPSTLEGVQALQEALENEQ